MAEKQKTRSQLLLEMDILRKRLLRAGKSDKRNISVQKALAEEQHLLNVFMQHLPDAIYFKDNAGVFLRINKAQADRLGLKDPSEAVGKSDMDFFSREDAERARAEDLAVMNSKKVSIKERKKLFSDGTEGWVSATKVPLPDMSGKIIGVFGLTRDITQRKRSEAELQLSRNKLRHAKRETDNILQNVKEGLFILDKDGTIGSQYSKALKLILEEKNLTKKHLLSLLKNRLVDDTLPVIREYLELMFNAEIDEESVNELNPLSDIELRFSGSDDYSVRTKFLSFRFSRIISGSRINGLIATVNDITEQVMLTRKLEESEAQSQRQMEWLLSILHVEPQLLEEFITSVQNELNLIEKSIKSWTGKDDLHDILTHIFRSIHLIKGNASLLDIKFFARKAHLFEEKIETATEEKELKWCRFCPINISVGPVKSIP